jgi:sugar lactone lactonase YvrE
MSMALRSRRSGNTTVMPTLPNGLAFDRAGNFVIANFGTDVDAAFIAGTMTPEVLGGGRMASVTFGDPDLRTVYLGSLMGHTLPSFRSPVPGLPMAHWHPHA